MVIFLFLRSFWATVIPAITVPLSLIGTFAVMYALGYSLDNLSLMALTIAVGFVVDDAIVVIENIVRHIEDGMTPMRGRAEGRRRDRLHHRLDHAVADRGVHPAVADGRHVGRLFQEFAVTVTMAIVSRCRLADADADDVRAAPDAEADAARGRLYRLPSEAFDGLLAVYDRGLRWRCVTTSSRSW